MNFSGWSGACSGTGPCTVIMKSATSVTANFALQDFRSALLPQACLYKQVDRPPTSYPLAAYYGKSRQRRKVAEL